MLTYVLSKLMRAAVTMLITVSLVFAFIRFSGDPAAALASPPVSQPGLVLRETGGRWLWLFHPEL